ncbi:MAG: 30S ribosomal protein S4 [Aphanocapsa lilacina HA4352-LM1]|jgi:small subunit ribosomal protein S4|nr:30S ribosomal protein S4 [Aphanocapsa lilacina HA4352-LM1]
MSRYTGPRLRIVRRLGELPGLTRKVPKKTTPPGQHGAARKKLSEYAIRLMEKQKLRFNYGLSETQLVRYVAKARRIRGSTGQALLGLLEMRLDNTVFRLGLAPTIPAARQMVNHGHICVNGRPVTIPSFGCRPGDIVSVRNRERSVDLVAANLSAGAHLLIPGHLQWDAEALTGRVVGAVERESVLLEINELLVVEYYSRRM